MKHNNLETMAREIFLAMNDRDFERFDSLVCDDVAFDFPGAGRVEGRRRTLLVVKSILRKYPELVFTITESFCSENRACVVWTNRGTSASGEAYNNSGMTLVHFEGKKISYISDYFKDTSFAS